MMKRLVLTAAPLMLLSACASGLGAYDPSLPLPRYALSTAFLQPAPGGPTPGPEIVSLAEQRWTEAIADAGACRISPQAVSTAGMVGAIELASMKALASRRSEDRGRSAASGLRALTRYAAEMALAGASYERRPSRSRCGSLARWVPEVNRQGSWAVRRAMLQGLLRGVSILGDDPR